MTVVPFRILKLKIEIIEWWKKENGCLIGIGILIDIYIGIGIYIGVYIDIGIVSVANRYI